MIYLYFVNKNILLCSPKPSFRTIENTINYIDALCNSKMSAFIDEVWSREGDGVGLQELN